MSILNDYFDKIYCVTVHDFYDRHEWTKTQLQGIEFEWILSPPPQYLKVDSSLSPSELSLILGHLNCIWNARIRGFTKIAIWEDDGKLIASEEEIEKFLTSLPVKWDCLYMANASWNKGLCNVYTTPLSEYVNKVTWGTGSGFNAIQSHVFDVFVQEALRFVNPVDYVYYKIFELGNSYSPVKGFFSDPMSVPNENLLSKIVTPIDLTQYLPSRIKHGA